MTDFNHWIESRNKFWRSETGFLAVTGMHWLATEPQTFKDVTGSWRAVGEQVFATDFDGNSEEQTWMIPFNSEQMVPMDGGVLEIANRGGNIALRPRRKDSKMFELFDGVDVFEYNPAFCVTATLQADNREVAVDSIIGDIGTKYISGGTLSFELGGQKFALTGFTRPDADKLWVIFKDETSGHETYGTGRHVTAVKQADDTWEIDFNKSANFPCAYTDFATCPIAPKENVMSIAITSGEKTPNIKSTANGVVKH